MFKKSFICLFGFGVLVNPAFAEELDTLDIIGKKAAAQVPAQCTLSDPLEFAFELDEVTADGTQFYQGLKTDQITQYSFSAVGSGLRSIDITMPTFWTLPDSSNVPDYMTLHRQLTYDVSNASDARLIINGSPANAWVCDWIYDPESRTGSEATIRCENTSPRGLAIGSADAISEVTVQHSGITMYFLQVPDLTRQTFRKNSREGLFLETNELKVTAEASCHSIN